MVRNVLARATCTPTKAALHDYRPGLARHRTTKHSTGEYVRYDGETVIHSNTIENVFSVFKRGMVGVYQHCGENHLHRYLAEFGFRYNHRAGLGIEDTERTANAVRGAAGKRLTYHQFGKAPNA